jgi:hypothetical protein
MAKSRIRAGVLLSAVIAFGAWVWLSQPRNSDEHQAQATTMSAIREWTQVVEFAIESGMTLEQWPTPTDALIDWQRQGFIEDERLVNKLLLDYWKRPFRWSKVDKDDDMHTVRIWSIGPNGVDENGEGDDLYGQIDYRGQVAQGGREIHFKKYK